VLTKSMCAVCYESEGLVQKKEVLNSRSTGGKDVLPICRCCFEGGITIVTSSAASSSESEMQAGRREKRIRRHREIRLWLTDAGKQGSRVWQHLRPEHN
jgi:hypothetical protein